MPKKKKRKTKNFMGLLETVDKTRQGKPMTTKTNKDNDDNYKDDNDNDNDHDHDNENHQ
jgi:hypothetical protein